MATNACPICGNARGSNDCKEDCSDREQAIPNTKSLMQTHYKDEITPFIAAAKAEVEKKEGRPIDLKRTSRYVRNEVMAKALQNWLQAKKK